MEKRSKMAKNTKTDSITNIYHPPCVVGQLYSKLNHFLILNGIRQAPGSEETAPAEEAPAENKITGENEND